MANRAGPNDWLSAEPVVDNEHTAYVQNVNANIEQLPPALGPQTAANSLSVVPATDSPNFPTADGGAEDAVVSSASATSAAVGATFTTTGYGGMTFQIIANASGNTIVFEGSNDGGTTWVTVAARSVSTVATSSASTTVATTSGVALAPTAVMPMMRWRVLTYVGGTTTIATGLKRSYTPVIQDAYVGGGTLTAVSTKAALTNGSSTITTGGTSQQVFAANTSRSYLFIQNPIGASETLFVDFGTAATTTAGYGLAPGGTLTFDGSFVPSGTVNVLAATTSHAFVAKQA